jgi:hypothetical protein
MTNLAVAILLIGTLLMFTTYRQAINDLSPTTATRIEIQTGE